MTEFLPAWMFPATLLYLSAALFASLVTLGWRLSVADERPRLSVSAFADAFRDRSVVAVFVLLGVGVVAALAGLLALAEVASVAGALYMGATLQLETMRTVAYYGPHRGETA